MEVIAHRGNRCLRGNPATSMTTQTIGDTKKRGVVGVGGVGKGILVFLPPTFFGEHTGLVDTLLHRQGSSLVGFMLP